MEIIYKDFLIIPTQDKDLFVRTCEHCGRGVVPVLKNGQYILPKEIKEWDCTPQDQKDLLSSYSTIQIEIGRRP